MSRSQRRGKLMRIAEGLAVGLVVLDAVAYFALIRPLRSMRAAEEDRYMAARSRVRELRSRVTRLETFQGAVPDAESHLAAFLQDHVASRRQGFSRTARLVRKLTEQSGVQLAGVSYKLDSAEDLPLPRLGFEVELEGPFSGLVKFSHALETAQDLVVVRNFTLEPTEQGESALRLAADLYLKP